MSQRDPSVHLRRTSLYSILQELDYINESEAKSLVDDIFNGARGMNAGRTYVTTKALVKKKIKRVESVDKDQADEFNAIYQAVLMDRNIRAVPIGPTDPRYITMKEVAGQAMEFCNLYNLKPAEGYKTYITLALDIAKNNFSINRMRGLIDQITKRYEEYKQISEDKDPSLTKQFYATWKAVCQQYIGRSDSITEPYLYIHFIHGRLAAEQAEANYADWIAAQFEKWASLGSTPELSQFYGDNASLAYTKYVQKHGKQNETREEKQLQKAKVIPTKTVKQINRGKKG